MTTLGGTIKEARQRMHLRQADLADVVSVDRVTLNRWENDHARPSLVQVARLQRVLRCDLRGFFPIIAELNRTAVK